MSYSKKRVPFRSRRGRRGATLVLMAFAIVGLLAFAAFAIDVGYLLLARNQVQNSADASAMAAAWALLDERRLQADNMYSLEWDARMAAYNYAHSNKVASEQPTVNLNVDNSPDGDVTFGRLAADNSVDTSYLPNEYNAVRVLVKRTNDTNGEVSLFFGKIFGRNTGAVQAEATAVFRDGITSFKSRSNEPFTSLLPFTMKIDDFQALAAGVGTDNFTVDTSNDTVSSGGDGNAEGKMYPEKTNGNFITPGNFGTLDIGGANNSTTDLSRQITQGVSSADLDAIGGSLSAGMSLNGDTGMSLGIKDDVASIIGQERTIPLYDTAVGTGNTTEFHIVGFAGIRILDLDLTGNNKYILIQPAVVTDPSAVSGDGSGPKYQVFEPVVLVK